MTRHLLPEEFDLLVDADAGIAVGFGATELAAHARACPGCAAELDAARQVAAELDALPRLAPSPRFAERVMQDVRLFEPWHVALTDAARRLVPRSRPLRALAAAGALASTALLTLVLTWLATRADALAFTGDAAATRFRAAFWAAVWAAARGAAGDVAASLLGDGVRTASGALVAGAAVVFVATLALAALALRAAAASARAPGE